MAGDRSQGPAAPGVAFTRGSPFGAPSFAGGRYANPLDELLRLPDVARLFDLRSDALLRTMAQQVESIGREALRPFEEANRELLRVALAPWGRVRWEAPRPVTFAGDIEAAAGAADPMARVAALERLAMRWVTPGAVTAWDTRPADDPAWGPVVLPLIEAGLAEGVRDPERLLDYVGRRLVGERYRPQAKRGKPQGSGTFESPEAFRRAMVTVRLALGPLGHFRQERVRDYLSGHGYGELPLRTLQKWRAAAGFRDWGHLADWVADETGLE